MCYMYIKTHFSGHWVSVFLLKITFLISTSSAKDHTLSGILAAFLSLEDRSSIIWKPALNIYAAARATDKESHKKRTQ